MVNDVATAGSDAAVGTSNVEDPIDTEERNMEQLLAAANSAGETTQIPPDKDSSTITIFSENSEVC